MPILDRFWWLRWLAAVYLLAGVVVLKQWADSQPYRLLGNGCFTCLFWVALATGVGSVLWLLVGGFHARWRKLRRLRALEGDLDAVPLEWMATDIARRQLIAVIDERTASAGIPTSGERLHLADPNETLLTLRWRWSTLWESAESVSYPQLRTVGMLLMPFAICGLISFSCGWLLGVLPGQLDLGRFLWVELPSVWITPYVVYGIWRPNSQSLLLLPFRRSPFGIVAGEDGIEERTRFGDRRFVRWEEARLLETRLTKDNNVEVAYEYILYGRRVAVRWSVDFHSPRRDVIPDGISRGEVESRSRLMLHLIAARCGLVPRTFDRKLQVAP